MPKKKPIDKRLNKLFNEINPEQSEMDPKAGRQERAANSVVPPIGGEELCPQVKRIQRARQERGCTGLIPDVPGFPDRAKQLGHPADHG